MVKRAFCVLCKTSYSVLTTHSRRVEQITELPHPPPCIFRDGEHCFVVSVPQRIARIIVVAQTFALLKEKQLSCRNDLPLLVMTTLLCVLRRRVERLEGVHAVYQVRRRNFLLPTTSKSVRRESMTTNGAFAPLCFCSRFYLDCMRNQNAASGDASKPLPLRMFGQRKHFRGFTRSVFGCGARQSAEHSHVVKNERAGDGGGGFGTEHAAAHAAAGKSVRFHERALTVSPAALAADGGDVQR